MERWQEELEIKQADFIRSINFFRKMSDVWSQLGITGSSGKDAYAKKKSAMYKEMESAARELFTKAGYIHLLNLEEGMTHADYIIKERMKPEFIIPELQDVRSLLY
jgi:hypothetical protein